VTVQCALIVQVYLDVVSLLFGVVTDRMYVGWFGLRKEFCPWMLDTCPVLQEYGNISYKVHDASGAMRSARQAMRDVDAVAMPTTNSVDQSGPGREPLSSSSSSSHKRGHSGTRSKRHGKSSGSDDVPKFVLPVVSIDMPDWLMTLSHLCCVDKGCVLDFYIRSPRTLRASSCRSFKTVCPIRVIHSAFF